MVHNGSPHSVLGTVPTDTAHNRGCAAFGTQHELTSVATAPEGSNTYTLSLVRLLSGLPRYIIPFAPLAFLSQCQELSRAPPSPLVFLTISTHFTATP